LFCGLFGVLITWLAGVLIAWCRIRFSTRLVGVLDVGALYGLSFMFLSALVIRPQNPLRSKVGEGWFFVLSGGVFALIVLILGVVNRWEHEQVKNLMGLMIGGLAAGVVTGFICELKTKVHVGVARTQHFRHGRIVGSKEHQDVPDSALSRAQPPGDPEPTDTALSLADKEEES